MRNSTAILAISLQAFMASVTMSLEVSAAANGEQETVNTAIQVLDQLRGSEQQMSMDERRLRFYLLNCDGTRQSALALFQGVPTKDTPLGVEIQMLAARANHDHDAVRQLKAIIDKQQSLMGSLLWLELAEGRSNGSIKLAGRELILAQEPAFLPAFPGYLRNNRGNWLVFAKHGSIALDLLDIGTAMSRAIIAEFPGATETVTIDAAAQALERFLARANTPTWRWADKHPDEKAWLEASLLYHAAEYERALSKYQDIVEAHSARPSAYYRLARLYEHAHQQKEADAVVLSGLAAFPEKNSPLLVLCADYDMRKGRTEESVAKLRKCLDASPEYAPAHMLLAEIHGLRGEKEAAIAFCANALAYEDQWGALFRGRVEAVLHRLVQSIPRP